MYFLSHFWLLLCLLCDAFEEYCFACYFPPIGCSWQPNTVVHHQPKVTTSLHSLDRRNFSFIKYKQNDILLCKNDGRVRSVHKIGLTGKLPNLRKYWSQVWLFYLGKKRILMNKKKAKIYLFNFTPREIKRSCEKFTNLTLYCTVVACMIIWRSIQYC